jgi:hypothetical protein
MTRPRLGLFSISVQTAAPRAVELREEAIDDLVEAYVNWREESITVHDTYDRFRSSHGEDAHRAYYAYLAALEREERAATVYGLNVERAFAVVRSSAQSCP